MKIKTQKSLTYPSICGGRSMGDTLIRKTYLRSKATTRRTKLEVQPEIVHVLQSPQRSFFHLLCLRRGFIEPRLKVHPSVFPSHIDSGPHIISQDDELR